MKGVIIAISIVLFLVIPIIIKTETYFDIKKKIMYFSLYMYEVVPFLRGKIIFNKKGIKIVLGNKEIKKQYSLLMEGKKTYQLLNGINVLKISSLI